MHKSPTLSTGQLEVAGFASIPCPSPSLRSLRKLTEDHLLYRRGKGELWKPRKKLSILIVL